MNQDTSYAKVKMSGYTGLLFITLCVAAVVDGVNAGAQVKVSQFYFRLVQPLNIENTLQCDANCEEPSTEEGQDLEVSNQCYKISKSSTYRFIYVMDNGILCFEEQAGTEVILKAKSILVQKGGSIVAGSVDTPYGSEGGRLRIQLYGETVANGRNGQVFVLRHGMPFSVS